MLKKKVEWVWGILFVTKLYFNNKGKIDMLTFEWLHESTQNFMIENSLLKINTVLHIEMKCKYHVSKQWSQIKEIIQL